MGQWGLLKANLGSIFTQRKLESALAEGHRHTAYLIITESIAKIVKAGLTPNEQRNLNELKRLHPQEMEDLMESAFHRGWMRDGKPNLSNAMDQVLIEVTERIKQARKEGEVSRLA
jgi:hypothetical protein